MVSFLDDHELVDLARQLRPLLLEHRNTAEENARIAGPVHQALAEHELFRLAAPVEVGGAELAYPHVLAVIEEIAAGDITAAWYVVNSIPVCLRCGYLEPPERDRVMAPSGANFALSGVPGGRAVPVEAGFELSGTWPLVTGCEDAEWALLGGLVKRDTTGDGPPEVRQFLVNVAELEIEDNWQNVAGMRGTGKQQRHC